ncbi:hypothetical protein KJR08_04950 [Streptococcus lutetiensis]|nr:hypothetical protein [Streptococcus lutetiensis]MBT0947701.1 hypothetical protein [Streptococcus lutetiensis]
MVEWKLCEIAKSRGRKYSLGRSFTRMPLWTMEQGGEGNVEGGTGTVEGALYNERKLRGDMECI